MTTLLSIKIKLKTKPLFKELERVLKLNKKPYISCITRNIKTWQKYLIRHSRRKIIETPFKSYSNCLFEKTSSTTDLSDYVCTTHTNVCFCVISISNFSEWSSRILPKDIFDKVSAFNAFVSEMISSFETIDKVEFNGDTMILMSGLCKNNLVFDNVEKVLLFCFEILKQNDKIMNIFKDDSVSLRIGVHVACW